MEEWERRKSSCFHGPTYIYGDHCFIPPLSLLVSLRQPAILENPFKY